MNATTPAPHVPVVLDYKVIGYTIETTGDDRMPYMLIGVRGARYGLMRQLNGDPRIMYPIREKNCTICSLKGYGFFTDADGTLEPLNT